MRIFLLLLLPLTLFADFSQNFLKAFPNRYFVETGTSSGRGVRCAFNCGFRKIRSVELGSVVANIPSNRLADIRLYHGDSGEMLWEMIADIQEPITFWLDAHRFPPVEGEKNNPILEELEAIAAHPIKTHTLLIDDINGAGHLDFDYVTLDQITAKILEINPDYSIKFADGGWFDEVKNNILVATVN